MIALALAIAAQSVPRALLDAGDAANLAYTGCLYATVRAAHAANVPVAEIAQRLQSSCAAEERKMRSTSIRIFAARGDRNPAGEADREIDESYRMMVEQYRRLPEVERQLRDFAAHCKANPQDCR